MTFWQKLLFGVTFAFHGKNALAIGTTAAMAGATAAQLGADPLPWIIGSGGAAVAFLLRRPATWDHALAHAAISVFAGGIGAPWLANYMAHYIKPAPTDGLDLVLAAVLSVCWPFFVPLVQARVVKWFGDGTPAPKNGGQ